MACNCALSPPLEFRRKITSDFHIDCKWSTGCLPSSAVASTLRLVRTSCPLEPWACLVRPLTACTKQALPPHPSCAAEGRWRLPPNCLFCPFPSETLLFLTLQSRPGCGTVTLLSGSFVLLCLSFPTCCLDS